MHEWGDAGATPVVCLHGIGGHGLRFRRLAEERLARRHRVVAVDLRGHGRSDFDPPWTLEAHGDDVAETLLGLGVESCVWVGHSFGGRLALELSARMPERTEGAVLLDPAVWVPPPIALERAEAARVDLSYATLEEAIEHARAHNALTPLAALEEEMREHLTVSPDGRLRFRRCASAVVTAFSELAKPPPLDAIRVRTLLVRGADSDVVPDVLVAALRDDMGDVLDVVTVPGGHDVLWQAFAETADAIERFLAA